MYDILDSGKENRKFDKETIMSKPEFLTSQQLANILNVSRQTIHNWHKQGKIQAFRVGRNLAIPFSEVEKIAGDYLGKDLSPEHKERINKVVKRTVKEYGETLRLLGNE